MKCQGMRGYFATRLTRVETQLGVGLLWECRVI